MRPNQPTTQPTNHTHTHTHTHTYTHTHTHIYIYIHTHTHTHTHTHAHTHTCIQSEFSHSKNFQIFLFCFVEDHFIINWVQEKPYKWSHNIA
jgi:hypothetical protein